MDYKPGGHGPPGGSSVQKHLLCSLLAEMESTVVRLELHFTLSLWTSGLCNLTEHYSHNHLFCLSVISLLPFVRY